MTERGQRDWLEFVRKAVEIPIGYSSRDLRRFRRIAEDQYPSLVKVIEAYLHFDRQFGAKPIEIEEELPKRRTPKTPILDLLRDPRLFPKNASIAEFAQRVVPNMRSYRFDKMSKGDIALRIVQHLETLDGRTRASLERSMREALERPPEHDDERESFMSRWEDIIKGIKF